MIFKFFWILRALFYKLFFGHFGFFCYIGKPIFFKNCKQIFIGNRVRIFPGARLEVHGKLSRIMIQDNVSIGQNLHIISGEDLIIEKNTTISANVLISNLEHEYYAINQHILEQPFQIKKTKIGENCFIGYGVVIQAGTILGKHCVVGANAVVRGEFPDYSVIVGIPAKIVKRYDLVTKQWKKTDTKGNFRNEI